MCESNVWQRYIKLFLQFPTCRTEISKIAAHINMFVSRYCEISFNSYSFFIILLIIYFLVFNTFSVRRYIFLSWYYTNSTSFSFTYTVLLLCYFAIIFVKYPMARGAWEERKTILSRMNVRIIGEEPSIILLGHRDKLDKREFRNYHSKPGHDSSLLPRSWDSSGIV